MNIKRFIVLLICTAFYWIAWSCYSESAGYSSSVNSSVTKKPSNPAFWEVSSTSGGKLYVLGTMHFGIDAFYPLPVNVHKALDESDTLVLEVNMKAINPLEVGELLSNIGHLEKGRVLEDLMSDDSWRLLKQVAQDSGMSINNLNKLKPWLAGIQLTNSQITNADFKQSLGVEQVVLELWGDKPIRELESVKWQLELFNSLPEVVQLYFLEETLVGHKSGAEYLKSLADAWLAGDVSSLERLITPREGEYANLFVEVFFEQRNERMSIALADMLDRDEIVFVAVGAGHLVGKKGLILLLAEQFDVKRITH